MCSCLIGGGKSRRLPGHLEMSGGELEGAGCGPACVPYALLGLHRAWFGHQMLSEAFFSSALIVTLNFSAHQNYPNRCGVYLFDLK